MKSPSQKHKELTNSHYELMIRMYTHNSVNIPKNMNELTIHTNTQWTFLKKQKGAHNSHYNAWKKKTHKSL
jgi:hypothetical protein